MAEVFGIVAGAAGLAGLFTPCVECFEYIQFGRSFGKDYETCLVKFDVVRLRLSRWGTSVGLGSDPSLTARQSKPQIQVPSDQIALANKVLQQILDKFEETEVTSKLFKTKAERSGTDTAIFSTSDLSSRFSSLHVTSKEIARRRQKGTNFLQKTAWALYEKKKFDRLLQDVAELMDDLENVFPAIKPVQRELCAGETAEFSKDKQNLEILSKAAKGYDELLLSAVGEALKAGGSYFDDFHVHGEEGAKTEIGNTYAPDANVSGAGDTYHKFVIGGKGSTHVGRSYG